LFIRMNRCKILHRLISLSLLDRSAFSSDKSRLIRFHVGSWVGWWKPLEKPWRLHHYE
jgi:hypothetical protein